MRAIGDQYEQNAVDLMTRAGLQLLCRNFSRKTGEIDIIALDNGCIVFVEVRHRSHRAYAGAAASVSRRKQQRIIGTAQLYLRANPQWLSAPCRFDVIAFEPQQASHDPSVNWIKSAFIS